MNFWQVKLLDAILPKYTYFCTAFEDIYKQVEEKLPTVYNEDDKLPPKTVMLYVCKMETEKYPIAKDDFIEAKTENITFKPDFGKCSDLQDFLEQSIDPRAFTLLILSESFKSQLRQNLRNNDNIIVITVDGKRNFNLKEKELSTTMSTVFTDTDKALEEVITSKVEPMYRKLFEIHKNRLKQRSEDDSFQGRAAECTKESIDKDTTIPNAPRCTISADKLSKLVAEMGALFDISDFPVVLEDKPDLTPITKELCDSLKFTCPSIKRIGYRFDTLEIQAVLNKGNEVEIKEKIRVALKKFNILHFEITECLEQIQFYTWVGSKIEVDNGFGTLGCILQDTARNEQYGAVSKHVVQAVEEVILNTGRNNIPGKVVKNTVKHKDGSLDIAAIKLDTDAVEDNCKFKNSKGDRLLRGILNETFIREGIRVYIYGATSSPNPGRGVITCSKMNDIDMRYTIIQIENSDNSTFASPGDSGAIVCAEDPNGRNVFVLGMVIGASVKDKNKYAAFLLSEGIQQLSEIMKKSLELK